MQFVEEYTYWYCQLKRINVYNDMFTFTDSTYINREKKKKEKLNEQDKKQRRNIIPFFFVIFETNM